MYLYGRLCYRIGPFAVGNGNEIFVKKAEFDEELYSSPTTQDSCHYVSGDYD